MKSIVAATLGAFVAIFLPLAAQSPDSNLLAPYKPEVKIQGTIRIFGGELKGQLEVREKGFVRFHPDAVFDNTFSQSRSSSSFSELMNARLIVAR